jgi:hypothetical protein
VEFMAEPSEIGRPPQRGPVDGRQYRPWLLSSLPQLTKTKNNSKI